MISTLLRRLLTLVFLLACFAVGWRFPAVLIVAMLVPLVVSAWRKRRAAVSRSNPNSNP